MPERQHTEKLSKNLSFRIAVSLWKRLGIFAREHETSVQAVVIAAVETYLDSHEPHKPGTKADVSARAALSSLPHLRETPKDKLHIA
jgi:hypothetical protein